MRARQIAVVISFALSTFSTFALAQTEQAEVVTDQSKSKAKPDEAATSTSSPGSTAAAAPPPTESKPDSGKFTPLAYVEGFYSYNFGQPSNGLTNFRGFDNRHNSFSLSNVALGGSWEKGPLIAKLTLQVGLTPNTYYGAETTSPGSPGAGGSDSTTWKYIQEANLGYKIDFGKGLLISGGLFLSPIGPESIAVKDNWNWSRSNLFYGLPFYHTGLVAKQMLTDKFSVSLAVYNGWNSVVDNNDGKSISARFQWEDADKFNFSVLYFGGPERNKGAPEGQPWRHDLDGWATYRPVDRLWLGLHGNSGFEKGNFGTSSWYAGALYGQVRLVNQLYLAARGDAFHESSPNGATRIFWPSDWMASGTFTVDIRPVDNLRVMLEYRHDAAAGDTFYKGDVPVDAKGQFIANSRNQDTVTLGFTAWY